MLIYFSKVSLQNFISEFMSNEQTKDHLRLEPLVMKVSDLDEIIEGYATGFHEDMDIKITAYLDDIAMKSVTFDEAFGTISFTASLRLDFSNPYDNNFLSA